MDRYGGRHKAPYDRIPIAKERAEELFTGHVDVSHSLCLMLAAHMYRMLDSRTNSTKGINCDGPRALFTHCVGGCFCLCVFVRKSRRRGECGLFYASFARGQRVSTLGLAILWFMEFVVCFGGSNGPANFVPFRMCFGRTVGTIPMSYELALVGQTVAFWGSMLME
ncbi:hypothetical protein QAD02_000348 [Eretmocerus hayati]|uniref:Uncharacterized protein n=1 Tax=Eretmocerus hayati TaxID=131215 RepID=A0ACC2NDE7_9HYME|nr:hypothetical protein QAD02_000348 [Eretmocerus hayati]